MSDWLRIDEHGFDLARSVPDRRWTWQWDDLVHVGLGFVYERDRFFWQDTAYLILRHASGEFISIYRRQARRARLLDGLAHLPGFDRAAAAARLERYDPRGGISTLWYRKVVRCNRCGQADMLEVAQAAPARWDHVLQCAACHAELRLGAERLRDERRGQRGE